MKVINYNKQNSPYPTPTCPIFLPFPSTSDIPADRCVICNCIVKEYHKSICCDTCHKWVHIECSNVSDKQYEDYQTDSNLKFDCIQCKYPNCGLCETAISSDHKTLKCDKCLKWVHIKCSNLSNIQYENYKIKPELKFECRSCQKCRICEKPLPLITVNLNAVCV